MPMIKWTKLPDPDSQNGNFERTDQTFNQPWLLVRKTLQDVTHLQITATGSWSQAGDQPGPFDPDGVPGVPLPKERLDVQDCPPGALIGKFGGSSASLGPVPAAANAAAGSNAPSALTEGKAFAIGAYCLVAIPTICIGPLFVSFNGLARPIMITRLTITLEGATPTL